MKTFTMKEFELKEDKIFDLAKQAIHAHPHRRGRISKTNPKRGQSGHQQSSVLNCIVVIIFLMFIFLQKYYFVMYITK